MGHKDQPGLWKTGSLPVRTTEYEKRANDVIRHSIRDDGVLSAMLLGERGSGCRDKSLYQRAGIAHVLAISGLHISLLGMGLYRLLRKRLHTRYVTAALATTVVLISYAV